MGLRRRRNSNERHGGGLLLYHIVEWLYCIDEKLPDCQDTSVLLIR